MQVAMETQTLGTDLWTWWGGRRKEKSGTNGESNTEALPYVKYITSGNLLYDSGNSNQGSITT